MLKNLLKRTVERFPEAATIFRNLRDQLDRRRPAIETPWGFTLAGHEDMAEGRFEPEETKLVRDLLEEVDVLVNVGANVGYYCCHALSLGKYVIAVEPIARNVYYLMRNIRNNGWEKNTEIYPVAVGSSNDILEIWGGNTGASLIKGWAGIPESYKTNVPVLTLDRLLGNELHGKRALIVVDVEGAELMMLQGATNTLDNDPRPIWMVEISTTEHQPHGVAKNPTFKKTFEVFLSREYHAYPVDNYGRELMEGDVAKMFATDVKLSTRNYIFQ